MLAVCPFPGDAAPPASGALITNQATASLGATALSPSNVVSVTVMAPELQLALSGSPAAPLPNGLLTLTLTVSNSGAADATGTPVSIDGVSVERVVVLDPVPAQTTFDNLVSGGGAVPLYHLVGHPANEYVTTPPADRSQVDAVGFALPSLAAATSATFAFTVRLSGSAAGILESAATVLYASGAASASRASNLVTVAVSSGGTGMFVEKRASRAVAEPGERVDYEVVVKNVSGAALADVTVTDRLPAGFVYQRGSARLGGLPLADPEGGGGPTLTFRPGALPDGGTATLAYRVLLSAGSLQGDGTNRVSAAAAGGASSNEAAAKVKVVAGVFTDRGFIVGKVFADCDGDRVQSAGEAGIPGVRVFMEDGGSAVTDGEGRYSFYGVLPGTHVLKVDESTLPAGALLVPQGNRNARSGGTRFVDLKSSEMHKADFVVGSCPAPVREAIGQRKELWKQAAGVVLRAASERLPTDAQPAGNADPRSLPSGGTLGSATIPAFAPAMPMKGVPEREGALPAEPMAAAAAFDFEKRFPEMSNLLDFVDLKEGDVLPYRQAPVVVKGLYGTVLRLLVNGREVPAGQVGRKGGQESLQIEAWEYVGVEFTAGSNELTVVQFDPFGNERGRKSIRVTAPGNAAKLSIRLPEAATPADGASAFAVRVALTDEGGVPVTVRTPVTIEASSGRWKAADLNPTEPGLQQFLEGGSGEFLLTAPAESGDVTFRVTSGSLSAEKGAYFPPSLRPLVAAGLIDGLVGLRNIDPRSLSPAREQDGFERELRTFAFTGDGGKAYGGARTAFFLKGKVRGDVLLTMAYDSDKETRQRLFRDIQPDEFYPVYGDESVRGYDAQSTGRFFVRLEKGRSSLLYGDYSTQAPSEVRKLGAYSRSLTGYRGHYESGRLNVTAFGSRDSSSQVIEEMPGRGLSGPYYLGRGDIVGNSEQVEILVRDRNQPSIVLRRTAQARFSDYEVEPLYGRILFKSPVPSVDENLNPVSIRVAYETEQGGERFWIAGADAQARLHDRVEVGGSVAHDDNPVNRYTLGSANATVKVADETFLIGEWARSDSDEKGSGNAARAELRHGGPALSGRAYVEQAGLSFDNPSSTIQSGRLEAGVKAHWKADRATGLKVEAIRSEDRATGAIRDGALVNLERTITRWLRGEAGVRYARDTAYALQPGTGGRSLEYASARAKLNGQVPQLPKAGLYGEYEKAIGAPGSMAAVGGEYQVASASRLYARHEFISSLAGEFSLNGSQRRNVTVFGADGQYMKDGSAFSEYRIRDGLGGAETETAVGLRNGWQVGKGLRANTSFERVRNNVDDAANATAVAGALESTGSEAWKGSTRLEYRTSSASDEWMHSSGVAYKASRAVTLLGRYTMEYTDNKALEDSWRGRLRGGLAYRPPDRDEWNALAMYEHRAERDAADPLSPGRRSVDILSTHLNWQPLRPLALAGHYAGKVARDDGGNSLMQMIDLRATYDLTESWDVGVAGGTLFREGFAANRYMAGIEVGRVLAESIWASLGYNLTGYHDRDLTAGDYTMRGAYLRLRIKFDERIVPGFLQGGESGRPAGGDKP